MNRLALAMTMAFAITGIGTTASAAGYGSTGGCFPPTDAAYTFIGNFFSELGSLSHDEDTCKKQCDVFLNNCKKTIDFAKKCVIKYVSSQAAADKKGCKEGGGRNNQGCIEEETRNVKNFRDFINKENWPEAGRICEARYDQCLEECANPPC